MFYDDVMQSVAYIRQQTKAEPVLGIVLGSGLGSLVDAMEERESIPYKDIPFFPQSNLAGHADQLVFGRIAGTKVVAMQGRFHYYEGFTMKQVTYPIFVLKQLGVKDLIVTNACGGINPSFVPGDLMLIDDYINTLGNNPLIGPNDERFGPRFPDMSDPYANELRAFAAATARQQGIEHRHGVYAIFSGPCFESAAEIRALHVMGADAVGMSTVPETIVANYLGMRVLGIACITNMATGIAKTKHSHEEVLAIANRSSRALCQWVQTMIEKWPA